MDQVLVYHSHRSASYKNTVDILDEMTINAVKTYAMVKIFPQEYELILKTEENSGIK